MSESSLVREFTLAADQEVPNVPMEMSKEEINFICKMIIDEMLELCSTVYESKESKEMLKKCIMEAKEIDLLENREDKMVLIAEQQDAFVDIIYYIHNAAVKKGVNLSDIFYVVHNANMAKRDKTTGKFIKREDGKIMKPEGWKAPDIKLEIMKQFKN